MTHFDVIRPLLEEVHTDEPMSRHTSFRIGGSADVFTLPKTSAELISIWDACKKNNIPLTVLGDGANVLVADKGIRGVVVLTNKIKDVTCKGERIIAQAGARLSAMAEVAACAGLSGLAFASGIPGTVGGAICMNAGAYGSEIKDFCESVTLYIDGEIVVKSNADMQFGYRKSFAQNDKILILDATFELAQGDVHEIKEEMKVLNSRRRESQPLEYHSAGSFFKRPEGHYAGRLIEDSGLKGFAIGDAQVSEKHAGFVINRGNATARDVIKLMEHVQKKVFEGSGVMLEPEVRIIGEICVS
ncbi:MAG: UDP-N-acetylmuramate dehydrogenase [Defluviitaleaceae bacterium]|nr:UDP-N-acetylmuramate dehydrogenase [Defluviitaleaceae bacterium]